MPRDRTKPYYSLQQNDDGTLSIVTDGDCIAHSDANHGKDDEADWRNFTVMVSALNYAAAIGDHQRPFRFERNYPPFGSTPSED